MINARCNNKPEMSKVSKFVELFFSVFFFYLGCLLISGNGNNENGK